MAIDLQTKEMVKRRFLEPMMTLYSPPRHLRDASDQAAALEQYTEMLSRFGPAELDAGWRQVRDTHGYATWPGPVDCVKACRTAKTGGRQAGTIPRRENMKARNEYTSRRVPGLVAEWQWAHDDIWQRAKAEGWSFELLMRLRKLAWTVAHREYDKEAEEQYRVELPATAESEIRGAIASRLALAERPTARNAA